MKISISRSAQELAISLRGDLNESCEDALQDLLSKIEVPSLVIDVERVELINSLGARYWINFVQNLAKNSVRVRFSRCSPAFIDSCNTYPKFAPKNSIESLFLPAACPSCGDVDPQLVAKDMFSSDNPLESCRCQKCSKALLPSLDVEEFLQSVRA